MTGTWELIFFGSRKQLYGALTFSACKVGLFYISCIDVVMEHIEKRDGIILISEAG